MPLVRIEILKGKDPSYKKSIMAGVHKALLESLKIKEEDNFQRLYELEKENFAIAPHKTEKFIIIEITLFRGRSYEAKKGLYKKIVENLGQSPGISGEDIMIVLHEVPLEHWGLQGGKPANEINFDFNIHV